MTFVPHSFIESEDSSKKSTAVPAAGTGVETVSPIKLDQAMDPNVLKTADSKVEAFQISQLMRTQMGLDELDASRREAEIKKEIDRRWIDAKEKSEVEGYTEGLNQGKIEAREAEKPRIEEKIEKLDSLIAEIDGHRQKLFKVNEDFLMDLLAQVLRVITLKEIKLDKEYVSRLVLHLLNQTGSREDLKILISEEDASILVELRELVKKKNSDLKNTTISKSSEVEPGSCKIETNFIVIDASIEEQIKNAMTILKNES